MTAELIKALIKAKGEIAPITKDKKGARSTYASLDAVLAAVEPALLKNGLTIVQLVNGPMLDTHLYHTSGSSLVSQYPLELGADSQRNGSAITYARRYALCALLSVTAEEDDDGAKASPSAYGGPQAVSKAPKAAPKPTGVAAEAKQLVKDAMTEGLTIDRVKALCSKNNLPTAADQFSTREQVYTLAQILQDEIAKVLEAQAA